MTLVEQIRNGSEQKNEQQNENENLYQYLVQISPKKDLDLVLLIPIE
jgi:hypothetical protein